MPARRMASTRRCATSRGCRVQMSARSSHMACLLLASRLLNKSSFTTSASLLAASPHWLCKDHTSTQGEKFYPRRMALRTDKSAAFEVVTLAPKNEFKYADVHLYFQVRYVLLDVRRLELEITPVHACGRFHRHSWLHHKFLQQHNRDILMIAAGPPQLRRGAVLPLQGKTTDIQDQPCSRTRYNTHTRSC